MSLLMGICTNSFPLLSHIAPFRAPSMLEGMPYPARLGLGEFEIG